jgi:Uma2 family endonuclease
LGAEATSVREPIIPQFDAETYLLWESRQDGRFELHHGFAVAFAGGTVDHAAISANLIVALTRLYPAPCRTFGSDLKVQVNKTTFYYPDAVVVCSGVSGAQTSVDAPSVVAEVLSESTRSYELIDKRAAYRGVESLDVYLIVHTTYRRIECDSRKQDRSWRTEIFDSEAIALGAGSLSLDEVYAGSTLSAL